MPEKIFRPQVSERSEREKWTLCKMSLFIDFKLCTFTAFSVDFHNKRRCLKCIKSEIYSHTCFANLRQRLVFSILLTHWHKLLDNRFRICIFGHLRIASRKKSDKRHVAPSVCRDQVEATCIRVWQPSRGLLGAISVALWTRSDQLCHTRQSCRQQWRHDRDVCSDTCHTPVCVTHTYTATQ